MYNFNNLSYLLPACLINNSYYIFICSLQRILTIANPTLAKMVDHALTKSMAMNANAKPGGLETDANVKQIRNNVYIYGINHYSKA